MAIIDNKVSKTNTLNDIIKSSNRSKNVLRKTNPDIDKKGNCIGYVVVFPASKWSKPKYTKASQSIKNCKKNTVKKHTKVKPKTQVCRDTKGKIVACKKCVPAPWMAVALKEAKKVKGRKKWEISSTIKKYFKYSRPNSSYGAETSWCMAFVCWTLKEGNLTIERKFIGSQWLRFPVGHTKKISTPFYGAIAIWQDVRKVRGKWKVVKGGNGHISMVYGKLKNGKYVFLGGNQGKTIKLTAYDTSGKVFTAYGSTKRRFVGFYKPEEYTIKKCDKIKKVKSLNSENKKITGKSIKTVKNERT